MSLSRFRVKRPPSAVQASKAEPPAAAPSPTPGPSNNTPTVSRLAKDPPTSTIQYPPGPSTLDLVPVPYIQQRAYTTTTTTTATATRAGPSLHNAPSPSTPRSYPRTAPGYTPATHPVASSSRVPMNPYSHHTFVPPELTLLDTIMASISQSQANITAHVTQTVSSSTDQVKEKVDKTHQELIAYKTSNNEARAKMFELLLKSQEETMKRLADLEKRIGKFEGADERSMMVRLNAIEYATGDTWERMKDVDATGSRAPKAVNAEVTSSSTQSRPSNETPIDVDELPDVEEEQGLSEPMEDIVTSSDIDKDPAVTQLQSQIQDLLAPASPHVPASSGFHTPASIMELEYPPDISTASAAPELAPPAITATADGGPEDGQDLLSPLSLSVLQRPPTPQLDDTATRNARERPPSPSRSPPLQERPRTPCKQLDREQRPFSRVDWSEASMDLGASPNAAVFHPDTSTEAIKASLSYSPRPVEGSVAHLRLETLGEASFLGPNASSTSARGGNARPNTGGEGMVTSTPLVVRRPAESLLPSPETSRSPSPVQAGEGGEKSGGMEGVEAAQEDGVGEVGEMDDEMDNLENAPEDGAGEESGEMEADEEDLEQAEEDGAVAAQVPEDEDEAQEDVVEAELGEHLEHHQGEEEESQLTLPLVAGEHDFVHEESMDEEVHLQEQAPAEEEEDEQQSEDADEGKDSGMDSEEEKQLDSDTDAPVIHKLQLALDMEVEEVGEAVQKSWDGEEDEENEEEMEDEEEMEEEEEEMEEEREDQNAGILRQDSPKGLDDPLAASEVELGPDHGTQELEEQNGYMEPAHDTQVQPPPFADVSTENSEAFLSTTISVESIAKQPSGQVEDDLEVGKVPTSSSIPNLEETNGEEEAAVEQDDPLFLAGSESPDREYTDNDKTITVPPAELTTTIAEDDDDDEPQLGSDFDMEMMSDLDDQEEYAQAVWLSMQLPPSSPIKAKPFSASPSPSPFKIPRSKLPSASPSPSKSKNRYGNLSTSGSPVKPKTALTMAPSPLKARIFSESSDLLDLLDLGSMELGNAKASKAGSPRKVGSPGKSTLRTSPTKGGELGLRGSEGSLVGMSTSMPSQFGVDNAVEVEQQQRPGEEERETEDEEAETVTQMGLPSPPPSSSFCYPEYDGDGSQPQVQKEAEQQEVEVEVGPPVDFNVEVEKRLGFNVLEELSARHSLSREDDGGNEAIQQDASDDEALKHQAYVEEEVDGDDDGGLEYVDEAEESVKVVTEHRPDAMPVDAQDDNGENGGLEYADVPEPEREPTVGITVTHTQDGMDEDDDDEPPLPAPRRPYQPTPTPEIDTSMEEVTASPGLAPLHSPPFRPTSAASTSTPARRPNLGTPARQSVLPPSSANKSTIWRLDNHPASRTLVRSPSRKTQAPSLWKALEAAGTQAKNKVKAKAKADLPSGSPSRAITTIAPAAGAAAGERARPAPTAEVIEIPSSPEASPRAVMQAKIERRKKRMMLGHKVKVEGVKVKSEKKGGGGGSTLNGTAANTLIDLTSDKDQGPDDDSEPGLDADTDDSADVVFKAPRKTMKAVGSSGAGGSRSATSSSKDAPAPGKVLKLADRMKGGEKLSAATRIKRKLKRPLADAGGGEDDEDNHDRPLKRAKEAKMTFEPIIKTVKTKTTTLNVSSSSSGAGGGNSGPSKGKGKETDEERVANILVKGVTEKVMKQTPKGKVSSSSKTGSTTKKGSSSSKDTTASVRSNSSSGQNYTSSEMGEHELSPTRSLRARTVDLKADPIKWPAVNKHGSRKFQREFVKCDLCNVWFHYGCVGIEEDDMRLEEVFSCPPCLSNFPLKNISEEDKEKGKCGRPNCIQKAPKSNEYFVERIMGRKQNPHGRGFLWLVKWDSYPIEQSTWQSEKDMTDPVKLIEEFVGTADAEGKALTNPFARVLLNEAASTKWGEVGAI